MGMSAFAKAIDDLFGDPNIGRDAVYTPDGGSAVPVRIIARRADEITGFG
ncbi:head-tail joining protein, partial [Pseudorhodoplanes sp.]